MEVQDIVYSVRMEDMKSFLTGHKRAVGVGATAGAVAGAAVIGLMYLFVYVWPWSVLIGCAQ